MACECTWDCLRRHIARAQEYQSLRLVGPVEVVENSILGVD
jgi:hypothetical protein